MRVGVRRFSVFRAELLNRYDKGFLLSGLIYIHPISDNQFGQIAERNFDIFCKICGDAALKNVILVTNLWDGVSPDIGEARKDELCSNLFKSAIYKGSRMVPHHNTVESAHDVIRMIMTNPPIVLRIQRELVDERRGIIKTTAGEAIGRESDAQTRWYQTELERIQEDKRRLEEEHKRQLADLTRRLQDATGSTPVPPVRIACVHEPTLLLQ